MRRPEPGLSLSPCQIFSLPDEGRVTVKREKLCRVDGQIVTRHGAESVLLMNTDHLKAKRLTHRGKGLLRLGISNQIKLYLSHTHG